MPGDIPIRANGDGTIPVPGWTDEYEWTGYIPFEELPNLYNPASGLIVTANQRIVGRKAAGDPKFTYTAAMKKAKIVWTPANIQKLLTDPNKMVPNTAMPIALPSAKDRQDVIAYLATLK